MNNKVINGYRNALQLRFRLDPDFTFLNSFFNHSEEEILKLIERAQEADKFEEYNVPFKMIYEGNIYIKSAYVEGLPFNISFITPNGEFKQIRANERNLIDKILNNIFYLLLLKKLGVDELFIYDSKSECASKNYRTTISLDKFLNTDFYELFIFVVKATIRGKGIPEFNIE